jgi:endonuclease III
MDSTPTDAWEVYRSLAARYGEPVVVPGEDPTDMLIGAILSANTTDRNSDRAFDRLKALGDWDAIRTAPLEQIVDAIRPAGMYYQKGPHIVATLERLRAERGHYDLHDLADLPAAEAMAFLTSLPGVGHKTASIVLLFCFNGASFPVDTHIQRISGRLGLTRPTASPEAAKRAWEALLPPETYYPLHLNLIRLGREICQARAPRCEQCPLQHICDYYHRRAAWA